MVEQLQILSANPQAIIDSGFTTIEIWQSLPWRDGHDEFSGTDYCEITSATPTSATLTSADARTQFRLGGTELQVAVDGGAPATISFTSFLDYWTPAQVITQINTVVAGLASLGTDGLSVVLTSPTTGRTSSLQIVYTDAVQLGWTEGQISYGTDGRLLLVPSQTSYSYIDVAGLDINLYKWRYSANGALPISDFSKPVHGMDPPAPGVAIALATAQFIDGFGKAIEREVIVSSINTPQVLGGMMVGSDRTRTFRSDCNGNLQIPLVQGASFRIAIEGTGFIRDITVPTGSGVPTFDLLDAMTAAAADAFTVQTPPPLLTRLGP